MTTYSPSRGQPDCRFGRLLNRPWPRPGEAIKTRPRPEPAALDDPEPACCRNRIPLICPRPGGPPPASGQHCAVSGQGMSVEPPLTHLPDYCILVFMYT
jgi:hypothetical protein